jgi:excisionase family DNA binding protein
MAITILFNDQSKALLKIPEVAVCLSVCPRTVWTLIAMGELKAVKIRGSTRISAESIEALIKKGSMEQK